MQYVLFFFFFFRDLIFEELELTWKKLIIATVTSVKSSQYAKKWGIIVSSRLSLLIVVSLISEVVIGIRATNNCTGEQIRVTGLSSEPSSIALSAANERRILLIRHDRRSPVVHLLRVIIPIPNHITRGSRVVSKDIVHLSTKQTNN